MTIPFIQVVAKNLISLPVFGCLHLIGFYASTPLPRCTKLEALFGHNYTGDFQVADRISMLEILRKLGPNRLGGSIRNLLNGFDATPIRQSKSPVSKTVVMRRGNAFWWLLPNCSDFIL